MKTRLFPHISRNISAHFFVSVVKNTIKSLIAVLLVGSMYTAIVYPYRSLVMTVLQNPRNAEFHVALAQNLWNHGLSAWAHTEITIAQAYYANASEDSSQNNVLGASLSPSDAALVWKNEAAHVRSNYLFWKRQVREKPDFKDAYVSLGIAAYQLHKNSEAHMYLKQALALYPNDPTAQHVLYSLGSD